MTAKSDIGYPNNAKPRLQMKHIDGPYVVFRNGEMRWLSWGERFAVWLGRADAMSLERKYRPRLSESRP